MSRPMDVAVIIPAFDEARVVRDVVAGIAASYPLVVCVDDGSVDDTAGEARRGGAVVLRHCVNVGQGAALETGIQYALASGAEIFVTMDADGQHDVVDVVAMVERLRESPELDLLLGSRFLNATNSEIAVLRRGLLRIGAWLAAAVHGMKLTDVHNGLRAFRRNVAQRMRFVHMDMGHASEIHGIVRRHGFRWAEHPVRIRYTSYSRAKGQPLLNAINIAIDSLLNRGWR